MAAPANALTEATATLSTLPTAPASLYVGDLDPDTNDAQLFDAFSEFNSLASVRVCRDSSSGRSLCYGYVNFISPHDAMHAIEAKNHTLLNGKMIRVTWSHRDPDGRRSGVGNVFVKNISESMDSSKLQEIFAEFGTITSCKVATSEDGKSRGYGFVQFDSEESANAAIENLNGFPLEGKQMYVAKFVKKGDRVLANPDAIYTNLYVKNLDPEVNEELLEVKFSKFGKIISLVIAKDEGGNSKGFGFVNFESPDNARRATEAMNGSQLGSKNLYVARAQKKAEREQLLRRQFEEKRKGLNVYIKNINDDVTDDNLRELFSQCGTITSAKLMRNDNGISKGFGFVCFSTSTEATKAVNTFHGHMFHRKPLYVAIAQRKEDRQAQLQRHYAQHMAGLAGPSAPVIPNGYPPLYYTPPGVIPQVSPRQGLMYQPMGVRPGWRGNGFAPAARPAFQPAPMPIIPNYARHKRQNRGRINGSLPSNGGPSQAVVSLKDSANQQQRAGQTKYMPNGRREMDSVPGVSATAPNGPNSPQSQDLSSRLAASSPERQKQILGDRLFPLVEEHKPNLAAKITGMLLEMDNSELLLLLESPESLAAKVEEAVQVLKLSKTKIANQDGMRSSLLSAEVAVN